MADPPIFEPEDERIVSDLETLKVFFDPMRSRILQELAGVPRTIHQVAEALHIPFTRLYYHFHLLEKHGLIRLVETRSLAGAVEEKYYQITARMYVVDRKLMSVGVEQDNEVLELILSSTLEAARDDVRKGTRRGVINLSQIPPHPDALLLRRALLSLTPEGVKHFYEGLVKLLKSFAPEHLGPDPKAYNFVIGLFPTQIDIENDSDAPIDL